jgi:SpoVK/Ycf46/Vps4 family AAA+-type ATPase
MPNTNPIFKNYVSAGYPLLWIDTFEEYRAMVVFCNEVAGKGYSFYSWDRVDGIKKGALTKGVLAFENPAKEPIDDPLLALTWAGTDPDNKEGMPDNSILCLKDFHTYIKKDPITRKIRNLIPRFKAKGKVLAIISPMVDIPPEIEKDITVIHFKLPEVDELRIVLKSVCESAADNFDEAKKIYPKEDELILKSALGMTSFEAENAFSVSMVEKKCFNSDIIQREKASIVKKTGLLEVIDTPYSLEDIGGLENLKSWLKAREGCFSDNANKFGIIPPKGLLLVGVPGTGKSLSAKVVARAWSRPCLRLDVGKVFGSYVGESEGNLRRCLAIAEAIAPCVLFIDEFEKFFGGSDDKGAHETTKRVLAGFLTWMQDKTSDVFIVATANSVDSIPPAMLRGGRFDAIFWVDLPDDKQREEILNIHLRKVGRDAKAYSKDMKELSKVSCGFSGAEIEVWVREALVHSYSHGQKELMSENLFEVVKGITPISKLMGSEIQESRDWANERGIKMASISHGEPVTTETPLKRKLSKD